jgi:DNA/RNA endonuclease YhcR with UshA esterase domain
MKTARFITVGAALVLVVLLLTNRSRRDVPAYSAASEVTVRGVVQEVQEFHCPISGDEGTHLILQTDSGVMQVHVAPRRFLGGNGIRFFKGETVEVVGSVVTFAGSPALIARRISRGDQTFAFRTASGKPAWTE